MFAVAYRRYVLAVLTAVYTLNFVDRGLMILLLQPIKEDLHLSDSQLGFLTGIAFGLFYAILGLPLARWADRGNRVTITYLAIGLWGITVMSCLFVTNYIPLVCARMAAAVGESGCKPPTYSLVGDYFAEAAARTRAMAVYMMAGPLAYLTSFLVGGWLNELYGWRLTFFLLGIPGLILALLVKWTIVEPRNNTCAVRVQKDLVPSMRAVLRSMWRQRSCRHLASALILIYTMSLGLTPWYAAFMMRSHSMGTRAVSIWMGLTISLSGLVGVLIGGAVASRWYAEDERAQMRLSAAAVASLVPCFVAFLMLPERYEALVALSPLTMLLYVFLGPTYALLQRLVADEMRATMMAVVMMLANLIGMGVGSQLVGSLSDLLMPVAGSDSLRYAMLIMSFVALWAAYHFWQTGCTVKEDLSIIAGMSSAPAESARLESMVRQ